MSTYYYFNSNKIKVFPCSYRGYTGTGTPEGFNTESKLHTEFNLTRGINSSWPEYNSYLVSKNLTNDPFKLVVAGYYFEIKELNTVVSSFTFTGDNKSLYFGIKLKNLDIEDKGNTDKTTILTRFGIITKAGQNVEDNGSPDYLDEKVGTDSDNKAIYEFRGLVLTDESISNDDDGTRFTLRLTDSNGNICQESFLPEIRHGAGKNSLTIGTGLTAKNNNELVIGKYNVDIDNGVFVIGNGDSGTETKNILEVTTSGNTYASSTTPQVNDLEAAVVVNGRIATNVDPVIFTNASGVSGVSSGNSVKQKILFKDNQYKNVSWVSSTIGNTVEANSIRLGINDKSEKDSELIYAKGATSGCKLYSSEPADLGTSENRFKKLYLTDGIDMTVSGASKFSVTNTGELTCAGAANVNGNLNLNSDKFNVLSDSGNTTIKGTLSADGDFSVNNTKFKVTAETGATTIGDRGHSGDILTVNGNSNFNGSIVASGDITASGKTITAQTFNGTAEVAKKLTDSTNVGNSQKPIYFTAGNPTECGDTLDVNISRTSAQSESVLIASPISGRTYLVGTVGFSEVSAYQSLAKSNCYYEGGDMYASSYTATSDRRLKENIKDTEINALDLINKIKIKEFNFISDETKSNTIGCIAQELREVLPDNLKSIVKGEETEDSYLGIDNDKLIYVLIKAVQELIAKR